MNLFDAHALAHVLHGFTQVELGLLWPKIMGKGGNEVPDGLNKRMKECLAFAENFFTITEMPNCLADVSTAKHQWDRALLDISSAIEIVHRVQLDIVGELRNKHFLKVADDRLDLVACAVGDEFRHGIYKVIGPKVTESFFSTWDDWEEVANCLAAECNTAAVFHLMRIAEVGLRALASDRRAKFSNKPIDQQEWGTILQFLDGAIKDLRSAPATNWSDPAIKDVQIRFYSEVVAELRQFNEAWRRHISHAREDAFYNHDKASSIFKHVVKFMQTLAAKISENRSTPEYWTPQMKQSETEAL